MKHASPNLLPVRPASGEAENAGKESSSGVQAAKGSRRLPAVLEKPQRFTGESHSYDHARPKRPVVSRYSK